MTEIVKLKRFDKHAPWGFRLTGGRDLNVPLEIIRIVGGSIAEIAGLKVGDVVKKINGECASNLTHAEAQAHITKSGNEVAFEILHGQPVVPPPITPLRGMTPATPCDQFRGRTPSTISRFSTESNDSALYDDFSIDYDGTYGEYEERREPTEEEIAELLLENAEVIEEKGKNVIGNNFQRFIPKCDFIKDSAVFQVLVEEQIHKELSEKEQLKKEPNKRFSTFLSTPQRPIPKPKPKPEKTKKRDNSVQVNERVDEKVEVFQVPLSKNENQEECEPNRVEGSGKECDETGPDDECLPSSHKNLTEQYDSDKEKIINFELEEFGEGDSIQDEEGEGVEEDCDSSDSFCDSETAKSDFDIRLEAIKIQLEALRKLPSFIESHLNAVQQQIEQLVQDKHKCAQQNVRSPAELDVVNEEEEGDEGEEEEEEDEQSGEDSVSLSSHDEDNECDGNGETEIIATRNNDRPKEVIIEGKCENEVKRERPCFPLTPQPRPVVLPGGRRWRKPKDAYNDEFIAETLINQAEVLVGSTMGVNFRKYEPAKFDLSNSAVYKMVHNIESQNKGVENRPEIIPAEQDYYQSPINARHFYLASLAMKMQEKQEGTTEL